MYTVEGNEKDGYLLTNHLSTQIHVQKVWNGKKADFVKVELLANGQRTNVFITLHAENQWTGSFVDLKKYDENGQRIQYTIYEKKTMMYTKLPLVEIWKKDSLSQISKRKKK